MWVMEAVVFAILILVGIAFVVTFEVPTTTDESFLTYLDGLSDSTLHAWAAQAPVDSDSPFVTRLEQYVGEALMGDEANLSVYLDLILPEGAMYRMSLETGNGTIYVAGAEHPPPFTYPRSVASRELRLRPSGTFLQNEFALQDGLHPMRPMAIVIENGRVQSPTGIPVEVRVSFTNGTHPRTHTSVHYTSRASAPDELLPSASLFFADGSGEPIGHVALAPTGEMEGRLVVNESGGAVAVPAGTMLTLRLPTGWSDLACLESVSWAHCAVAQAHPGAPATLTSTLQMPVRGAEVTLPFRANYTDQGPTRLPFSALRAELSGHHAAVAELLVVPADNHLVQASSAVVGVTLSNPLGDAGPSLLVVTFANGRTADARVTRIELEPLDVSDPFGQAVGSGWRREGRSLVWVGNQTVPSRDAHDFAAQILANPILAGGSYDNAVVPLELDNELALDLARFRHDGVYKDHVPATTATSPGYPQAPGSHWMRTRAWPHGNLSVDVMPMPESGLMSELFDAHVTSRLDVSPSQARPGQTVTLTADFTGIMETLVDYGNVGDRNVSVTTNVYSPVSFLRKVPWATFETSEEALGHPPIWFMEVVDVNGDGAEDLLLAKGKAVYAFDGNSPDYDARLWKRGFVGNTNGLLALVDAGGDGETDVLVVTSDGEVRLLDVATGSVKQAYDLHESVTAASIGGDCSEDGRPEILVGTVETAGQPSPHGPTFVGLDDLSPLAAENAYGWLHVLESDGNRFLARKSIELGVATKVRDFANGTFAGDVCAFVTAEANGDVTAYDGSTFAEMWTHESGVPYERGGATQVLVVETDPPGHLDHGVPEVVYGDGDGWVTALNSTEPAPVPRLVDLASLLLSDELVDVDMVSESVGYAISKKGLVFKTIDAWVTVVEQPSGLAADLARKGTTVETFDFYDEHSGMLASKNNLLAFTDNGGSLFSWDQGRELPGVAIAIQFYSPSAAVFAVDSEHGLLEIPRYGNGIFSYIGWDEPAFSIWMDDDGTGLAAGPMGSAAAFHSGYPGETVENISLASDRDLVSIVNFAGRTVATDDEGHGFTYRSSDGVWLRENLTSSPELNLTWIASTTATNIYLFNLNGERGYGLADRNQAVGSFRTQLSLDDPFVGVSRAVDGLVVASTATTVVAFPEPKAERRWSFPGLGSIEELSQAQSGMVGTSRLGTFHAELARGNSRVITPLDEGSLANFGELRSFGADGWVTGTYTVGEGAVPVPIEPLAGRLPQTLQSNLVERYNFANEVVWSDPFPQESDADALAFALGDEILTGQRGGTLVKLRLDNGNQMGSSYPGDLTGTTVVPIPIPGQSLYGPYVAESVLRMKLMGSGTDVIQSAAIVNHFDVTPKEGPWSPRIYTLHLLVWPTV